LKEKLLQKTYYFTLKLRCLKFLICLIDTPMPTNGNLDKDENGKNVEVTKYQDMIGSLLSYMFIHS